MFKNIGKKLCALAKFLAAIGVIAVIAGLGCLIYGILEEYMLISLGLASMVSGVMFIIATWPLYAFGQLTDDVHALRVMACDQPEPVFQLEL